jgi:hypothetical protein
MNWDKLFEELMPKKAGAGRETHSVTRPRSLEAKVVNRTSIGFQGTKETHDLVLEFDKTDRVAVIKMLRDAAEAIEKRT